MNKIKLGITGYTGKMGQKILSEIGNFPSFTLSDALIRSGRDKISNTTINLTTDIIELCDLADLVIDFSTAKIFQKLIKAAISCKTALISGTTPLEKKDFVLLKEASKTIPVFYSQNMSIGISVLGSILRDIYLKLGDKSDIEIIEMHHRNKKDIPSGTTILLASEMLNKKDIRSDCIKRNLFEVSGDRPYKKIGISSVRGGTIAGQHEIIFMMKNENIKISHQALDRNIFAIGALKIAEWLYNKHPGLYSMKDFLNENVKHIEK